MFLFSLCFVFRVVFVGLGGPGGGFGDPGGVFFGTGSSSGLPLLLPVLKPPPGPPKPLPGPPGPRQLVCTGPLCTRPLSARPNRDFCWIKMELPNRGRD